MYNALPWWLTWIDGRVLLLVIMTASVWAWYWIGGLNDTNIYDDTDSCKACGEHISEAHQPTCPLDNADDYE